MMELVRRMRGRQARMLHGLVALGEDSQDTARGLQAPPVRTQASDPAARRARSTHESLHTALLLHEGRACPACRRSQHGDRILGSLEP